MTIEEFVALWAPSQASEKANAQPFLSDLCAVLGIDPPRPARNDGTDEYVFERRVALPHEEKATVGFIDLYKRGAFVLEAKQGSTSTSDRLGTAKRGTPQWTQAMQDARGQALGYARVLDKPVAFLIVTDVGYCLDLYACFDGSNSFRPYPTPVESRIFVKDLPQRGDLVERLRKIFQDPHSLDPSKQAIKVTREVAGHLAKLAKSLESRHPRDVVARFLMRCLFTMFAEDVSLLPIKAFEKLLQNDWIPDPEKFVPGIEALWEEMDEGREYSNTVAGKLLRFNGGLFRDRSALKLTKDELLVLQLATICDWSQVEPAIFGTLLERALDPKERHALGAHFTPRAYVERLVRPTVEEPLRDEWRAVRAEVRKLVEREETKKAAKKLEDFLHHLSTVRVLDPACGTGNFLYVTLDVMKAIESEARKMHTELGSGHQVPFGEGYSVTPQQLLGIEINPWAKEIAELVLWIGYLQWHFKTHGKVDPPEPVLRDYKNIECRDAVLEYDERVPRKGPDGQPLWHWDGETMKLSPVTGEEVPDESARTQVFTYVKPRKAHWPAADYIVSNPPFIGTAKMRQALGDGYVEALRATYPEVPESSDLVMYWWWTGATLLTKPKQRSERENLRRFGFITTNKIAQAYGRAIVRPFMDAAHPISIIYAIPDHPWVETADGADVRIAITVCARGARSGVLAEIEREGDPDGSGEPVLVFKTSHGVIREDLRIGAYVAGAVPLRANEGLSSRGFSLHGSGFIVSPTETTKLGLGRIDGLQNHLKPYINGRDLAAKPRRAFVLDLFGLSQDEVRQRYPEVFQRILEKVKPGRDVNPRPAYRENWWIFGEPRATFRPALIGLSKYIATIETSRHRFFVFLDGGVAPDNKLVAVASDDSLTLGVLSSHVHCVWALAAGGWLGVGNDPVYVKSKCFDPFPFPVATEAQTGHIRELAGALDDHRKARQAEHPELTLTGMYNVLEKLRRGEELSDKDKATDEKGLVSVLKKIHDDLDAAVLDAYGWPRDLIDEQIVERLVQLNAERATEEKKGLVRWLRPEFQAPESAEGKRAKPKQQSFIEPEPAVEPPPKDAVRPAWPKELADRMLAVRDLLQRGRTMTARDVAKSFGGRADKDRSEAVTDVLIALRALGQALAVEGSEETRWSRAARDEVRLP
jgi:hypothetical protein